MITGLLIAVLLWTPVDGKVAVDSASRPVVLPNPGTTQWTISTNATIWTNSAYNAFPFMCVWSNMYWVGFREGSTHVSADGRGRLLSSSDGETWTDRGEFSGPDTTRPDVRELMPYVAMDGALYVFLRGYDPAEDPKSSRYILRTEDLATWTTNATDVTIWQTVRVDSTLYAVGGATNLVSSTNGYTWTMQCALPTNGTPTSETALWMDGTTINILRRKNDEDVPTVSYSRYCDHITVAAPYTSASVSTRIPYGMAGGPWATDIGGDVIAVGTRDASDDNSIRPILYSWRDGVMYPELGMTAFGALGDSGYFSMVWTNSALKGVYYSDVSGKPCIYWFEVTP